MSVQFGRWNFDGRPADREYLAKAEGMLAPYGLDGGGTYIEDSVGILFRAFHTTRESRSEAQPHITPSGTVVTWDGRLDNRVELIRDLRDVLTIHSTDVAIVAAAFEEWGTNCFARLVGDWALSIRDTNTRSLILAKDPIGTRHLYYSLDNGHVTWSTILDPLVLLVGKAFALDNEYIAGWLSFFPATHLTPYTGIHAVPPSSSVLIRDGKQTVSKYWDFDPSKKIRYNTDTEYEEHFRTVFAESVRRRLRSNALILAELSGGMDSSSVVCVADFIIAREPAPFPRLDTLSYYDDSEPNWNERPYFERVEQERGRTGWHIAVNPRSDLKFDFDGNRLAATPASHPLSDTDHQFAECLTSNGYRVLLSGVGGDEVTGGVPTPIPELLDLLTRARVNELAHQLKLWALNKKRPWIHLALEAVRELLPRILLRMPKHKRPAPWLKADFVRRNLGAFSGYESRTRLFGPLPSFQENLNALEAIRRQLGCSAFPSNPLHEKRYPYLDRDLLEFLYAIPREQLVRPGCRRSLMRRALAGIVPDAVLQRKRKAFASRGPLAALASNRFDFDTSGRNTHADAFGFIDSQKLAEIMQQALCGAEIPVVTLIRTLRLEFWLRHVLQRRLLNITTDKAAPCLQGRRASSSSTNGPNLEFS